MKKRGEEGESHGPGYREGAFMHTQCKVYGLRAPPGPQPWPLALDFSHHPWLGVIVPGPNPLEGSSNGPLDTDNNSVSQTQQLTTNLLAASMNINSDGHRLLTLFRELCTETLFLHGFFHMKASTMCSNRSETQSAQWTESNEGLYSNQIGFSRHPHSGGFDGGTA